jgi:hypothetical protein
MHVPVYATLNGSNGGLLLDLSPSGMGVQAVAPLHPDETILLRFELPRPRTRVEAAARVAWTSASGQAGLRFAGMSPQTQRSLHSWIADAQSATPLVARGQERFFPAGPSEQPLAAAAAMDTAAGTESLVETSKAMVHGLWPRTISSRTLATLTDAMIVLLAVLVFVAISVAISGAAPSFSLWLISAVLLAGFFGLLYRYLFATYAGRTAGERLAGLGHDDAPAKMSLEDHPSK